MNDLGAIAHDRRLKLKLCLSVCLSVLHRGAVGDLVHNCTWLKVKVKVMSVCL